MVEYAGIFVAWVLVITAITLVVWAIETAIEAYKEMDRNDPTPEIEM